MESIRRTLSDTEALFNLAECTPVVCVYGGILRIIAGKVQQVAGIIITAIGMIKYFFFHRDYESRKVLRFGIEQCVHGALNTLRGFATAMIGLQTFGGIGNAILLIPNMRKPDPFRQHYPYGLNIGEALESDNNKIAW